MVLFECGAAQRLPLGVDFPVSGEINPQGKGIWCVNQTAR